MNKFNERGNCMADATNQQTISCHVKWFDAKKGFGFLIPDQGGPDILLHANVLRNAGRGSIADGVRLEAVVGQRPQPSLSQRDIDSQDDRLVRMISSRSR